MPTEEKWYRTRAGWIAHFKTHFDCVRALVAYYSGEEAAKKLDTFAHITGDETVEKYEALWHVLQQAWEDAPDSPSIRSKPGWFDLCDLCSEGSILWEDLVPESGVSRRAERP